MVLDAEETDLHDWDDPQRHTRELHCQHTGNVRRGQQPNIAQRLAHPTAGGPSFGPAHRLRLVAAVAEKEHDAWQRRRASKEAFPVLKDNMHHLKWKPEFLAELRAQKLEHLASQEFCPDDMRNLHGRKLCEQQNDCVSGQSFFVSLTTTWGERA